MSMAIWLKRIRKLSNEEVNVLRGIDSVEISEKGFSFVTKEDFDSDPDGSADLIPYLTEIPVTSTFFDMERCLSDRGFSSTCLTGKIYLPEGTGWCFSDGRKLVISEQEYWDYCNKQIILVYVWKEEDVALWQNQQELLQHIEDARISFRTQEYLEKHKKHPSDTQISEWETVNCGYYLLSSFEIQSIKIYVQEHNCTNLNDNMALPDDMDENIFFHAWW